MSALKKFLELRKQKFIGSYAELRIVIFLVLVAFLVLSFTYLNRPTDSFMGEESYYNYRIAADIAGKGDFFPEYDYLSYSGRMHIFSITPVILLLFAKVTGSLLLASRLFPILAGLMAVILFYIILRKNDISRTITIISCLAMILSPGFVYLFITLNNYFLPVLVSLIVLSLRLYEKYRASFILSLLLPFFGSIHAFIAAILFLVYSAKKGEIREFRWFLITVLLIVAGLIPLFFYGLPHSFFFNSPDYSLLKQLLSDLGGNFGFSIFAIFLAVIGITKLWEEKYRHVAVYSSIIILLLFSFFEIRSLFYLNFFIAFLAALGLVKLIELEWESKTIKSITILIVITGVIFSFFSHSYLLSKSPPNRDMINALNFLKDKEDGVVFSYYSNGILVNSIANKKNLIDSGFLYAPNLEERYGNSNELLFTRDIENATRVINKYDIRYILIDRDMEEKLWSGEEEGLLFLLKYSKNFNMIYSNNFTKIWEVVRE